jgi:uncharacterized protein YaaR (DUF327 family)
MCEVKFKQLSEKEIKDYVVLVRKFLSTIISVIYTSKDAIKVLANWE